VIIFVGVAYKKADAEHPYGHGKYETIASVLIGLMLFIIALFIGYEAIELIKMCINGSQIPIPSWYTIIAALISILAKEFCYQYTYRIGKKIDSTILIANAWHHRSDAISSVATLIGVSGVWLLGKKWAILDPICALIISVFIAISAYKIAKPSLNELLEVSLPQKQKNKIFDIILKEDGVKKVHNLRTRRNGHSYIIDVNIHVDPDITVRAAHEIATNVENSLRKNFEKDCIIYVHVEPYN
ncbi:MAG: cation diffusion facilitator family transporter, partial [Roseburia sp.]|nr:cation diffusion facilitator family transporter [Roseburia sp.]